MAKTEIEKEIMDSEAGGERDKAQYELALLLKSDDAIAGIAAFVRDHGGEMTSEPRARKLALAYKINRNTEAVFVTCFFKAAGSDAKQMENDLKMRPDVIRSMILRATTQGALPVAIPAAAFHDHQGARGPAAAGGRGTAPREAKRQPVREPISNEALENLLKEI